MINGRIKAEKTEDLKQINGRIYQESDMINGRF